jgi:3-oxoadipate enol-lactonase
MRLAHDVAGDGPVVLMLHSGVCDRRMWDPQWPALIEAGYRVVRCDFRGYGQTPAAAGRYTDGGDVRDLLGSLGIGRVALIASSYGGRVAAEFAARQPDRVTALALLCSDLAGHEPSEELRAFWAAENALLDDGKVAEAADLNAQTWVGPEASKAVRDLVREMQRHAFEIQLAAEADDGADPVVETDPDANADLSAITARCLAVAGGRDMADFREIAVSIPARIPGARHIELPWAGHLPSLERPDEVTPLLLSFFGAP